MPLAFLIALVVMNFFAIYYSIGVILGRYRVLPVAGYLGLINTVFFALFLVALIRRLTR